MAPARPFVIAGGGIAGLSTALALSKVGQKSIVLERRPEPAEIGAGIQLGPNAGKVLAWLGIVDDALDAVALRPQRLEIRSGRSGRHLASMDLGGSAARFGAPYRTLHRADLLRILLDAARATQGIEIRVGTELTHFSAVADGIVAVAAAAGGREELQTAGLIGADGVGSTVRAALGGSGEAAASGRTAWRALVQMEPQTPPSDAVTVWMGRGGHLVHYRLRGGRQLNIVAVVDDSRGDDRPPPQRFDAWAAEARAILARPSAWTKWPIMTVDPNGAWSAGPVTLVGDAAHAVSPHLAQGAGFAMEDAVALAAALAKHGEVAPAFAAYRAARIARTTRLRRAAETAGAIYHLHGPIAVARDLALRLAGPQLLGRYDWIYRWQPPD